MQRLNTLIISSLNGLGLNIVHKFAKQGSNIILNGNQYDENIIKTIQNEYQQSKIIYLSTNLQNEINIQQILICFQYIDVLIINNECKRHYRASIDEFPIEKWREIIDYNLISNFALIKTLWPHMKRQHFGHSQTNFFEQFNYVKTITDLILFLCTDQARLITGQSIPWASNE